MKSLLVTLLLASACLAIPTVPLSQATDISSGHASAAHRILAAYSEPAPSVTTRTIPWKLASNAGIIDPVAFAGSFAKHLSSTVDPATLPVHFAEYFSKKYNPVGFFPKRPANIPLINAVTDSADVTAKSEGTADTPQITHEPTSTIDITTQTILSLTNSLNSLLTLAQFDDTQPALFNPGTASKSAKTKSTPGDSGPIVVPSISAESPQSPGTNRDGILISSPKYSEHIVAPAKSNEALLSLTDPIKLLSNTLTNLENLRTQITSTGELLPQVRIEAPSLRKSDDILQTGSVLISSRPAVVHLVPSRSPEVLLVFPRNGVYSLASAHTQETQSTSADGNIISATASHEDPEPKLKRNYKTSQPRSRRAK